MKSITTALSAHLDGEVTTLASCWKIVRLDGKVFFFTDHDTDILFEGDTYEAESSYDRTAIQSNSDFGVDNLDVAGILDSEKITDEELRAGLFNRADVYVFIVNWKDPSQGALKVRRGWFGEVSLLGNGTFTTEIRGLAQALSHNFIEVYSSECRADFCDARCKLNIADFTQRGTVINSGDLRSQFTGSSITPPVGTPGTPGAFRYWSIKPSVFGSKFWIAEVRFYDTNGNLITGGTAKDNIPSSLKGPSPKNLRDGDYKRAWGFDPVWNDRNDDEDPDIAIGDVRWWIEFGSAVEIAMIEIIATDQFGEAFTAFEVQYTTEEPDVGTVWTAVKSCDHLWSQAGQSAIWDLASPGSSPINIAAGPVAFPPPSNGVTSYVGGTLTWITGKNAGRAVEVLGFNSSTSAVTLFEGMSYPIAVGDTFDIAQGCDGRLATCISYNNVVNRRAEDYVPGNDEMMSYPDAQG